MLPTQKRAPLPEPHTTPECVLFHFCPQALLTLPEGMSMSSRGQGMWSRRRGGQEGDTVHIVTCVLQLCLLTIDIESKTLAWECNSPLHRAGNPEHLCTKMTLPVENTGNSGIRSVTQKHPRKNGDKISVTMHDCNLSSWVAEAGGLLQFPGQYELHSEALCQMPHDYSTIQCIII